MSEEPSQQPPRIQDIHTFKKMLEAANSLSAIKSALPFFRPLLTIANVNLEKVDEALSNAEELKKQAEAFSQIPDRFNDLFAERGWIIYGLMNVDAAKGAIAKAEANDLDSAEEDLAVYHSPDTVRWKLRTMSSIKAFQPRMRLALLALEDYAAERYHASIPVVLALMDGLVNELHRPRKGFFAEGVDLTAWDSIAAHSHGLGILNDILKKGRYTTTTEKITVPYRNGILHGNDLAYDNKLVAAKVWAALFAVRDWAIKVEKGELEAPPPQPALTFSQLLGRMQDSADIKKDIERWEDRSLKVGVDFPPAGEPDEYAPDSPERRVVEYLSYWKKKNYGYMAKCLSNTYAVSRPEGPARVRATFASRILRSFVIENIDDQGPAITEITVLLSYEESRTVVEKQYVFRLMYQDEQGDPVVRSRGGGEWQLITWQV